MRVCHVSPHLPPDQAANALLPATLGRWSRAGGDEVAFVAYAPAQGAGAEHGESLPGPVRHVTRVKARSAIGRWLKTASIQTARAVTAALDAEADGADLLHLHSNGLIVEVAAAWARRRRVPTILTMYGTEIWHYRPRRLLDPFRRAYHHAREVTFYSQGLLDHARSLGLERAGLSVVYPAVRENFEPADEATRQAWKAALELAGMRVILNVKRLHPLAGQDVLIRAFADVARERDDARLVICGTGPELETLQRIATDTGVRERVRFTGLIPNSDVARYAAVADVFALPSRLEALPTVAVEALAAGTPVVSADHPGGLELHDLFGPDVRIVPREESAPLANALVEALDAPRRVSAATLDLVAERFGPAAIRQAYQAVYDRVGRGRV